MPREFPATNAGDLVRREVVAPGLEFLRHLRKNASSTGLLITTALAVLDTS